MASNHFDFEKIATPLEGGNLPPLGRYTPSPCFPF